MQGYEILNAKLLPLRHFLSKDSIKESEVARISKYISEITLLTSLVYKQKIESFRRVTINSRIFDGDKKRITEISHLKYPPAKFVQRYGRANFPNESILYATFDPITALSEMRPEIGDLITISTWKLKTDYDLNVTPIFKNSTKNGVVHSELSLRANLLYKDVVKQYDDILRKQLDIILQFIADCFSKEVNDSNHFDYFLSSHYAKRLFTELENGKIDAILYPSVRQSLTMTNIAMKPNVFDNNYELELIEESIVKTNIRGVHSGWFMEGTGYSKQFEGENIIWD